MYHVLLVDDEQKVRNTYSNMHAWIKYGFVIEGEASNGIQALEWLKTHTADVVFTDIRMPLMDGITLAREAGGMFPGLPFVFVSASDSFEYVQMGLRMGVLDYLVKPLGNEELEEALQRLRPQLGKCSGGDDFTVFQKTTDMPVDWENPCLRAVCRYLTENLEHGVTLEEVADALHMNPDYLGRVIKDRTGMHFRTLYNRFKIEYAKPLLTGGKYKVHEISKMLGYSSADYFTQQFKACTNMTPSGYRESQMSVFFGEKSEI